MWGGGGAGWRRTAGCAVAARLSEGAGLRAELPALVAQEARRRGVDGVVCGHIHRAEITRFEDILYCNDGDWVESCSALIEDRNGRLGIWNWLEMQQNLRVPRDLAAAKAV